MDKILGVLMTNPEAIMPTIKEYIEKYKPVVYALAQEMVEVVKDYSNNTEYPQVMAQIAKNKYDAYIKVGFSEEQAFALIINDNLELIKGAKQLSSNVKNINKD